MEALVAIAMAMCLLVVVVCWGGPAVAAIVLVIVWIQERKHEADRLASSFGRFRGPACSVLLGVYMNQVIWRKITHEATRSDAVPINEYILVARPSGVRSIAWELLDERARGSAHGQRRGAQVLGTLASGHLHEEQVEMSGLMPGKTRLVETALLKHLLKHEGEGRGTVYVNTFAGCDRSREILYDMSRRGLIVMHGRDQRGWGVALTDGGRAAVQNGDAN